MTARIEFLTSYDLTRLAEEWLELQSRSDGNFFLSWSWIGCWLQTTQARPFLFRVTEGTQTIALGFLSRHLARRHFRKVRQLCLNETGVPVHDKITIEHNGVLVARGFSSNFARQIFREIMASQSLAPWDELVLGGVSSMWIASAKSAGLTVETDRANADYRVDLNAITASGRDWQASLSANLRAQFRQSRTFAERMGPLVLSRAQTSEEAFVYFDGLRCLHDAYWRTKKKPGAFASEFSLAFHRSLISQNVANCGVELLQLAAGDQVLGYLYNFRYADTVCNYQSGFAYLDDNRHRPGLLAHGLAIEQSIAQGMGQYDFLAGDSQYKQRLGKDAGQLVWCRAQRNRPGLAAERLARRAKASLTRLLQRPRR